MIRPVTMVVAVILLVALAFAFTEHLGVIRAQDGPVADFHGAASDFALDRGTLDEGVAVEKTLPSEEPLMEAELTLGDDSGGEDESEAHDDLLHDDLSDSPLPGEGWSGFDESMGRGWNRGMPRRLDAAINNLRNVKSAAAKDQAKKVIAQRLYEYFDQDMVARFKELNQIKKRVAQLEAHFLKRKAARVEIVELQLKTLVNETEGLGFFSDPISGRQGTGAGRLGSF